MSTLRGKLESLTTETCAGVDDWADCAIGSLQTQAMARALLVLVTDEDRWPGQNGDHSELMAKLNEDLEQALKINRGDIQ